jgi:hypothetical protein
VTVSGAAESHVTPAGDETVVAEPAWAWALVFAGLPALGAGAGWLLTALAGRIADVPFAPLGFVFEWVDGAPQPATAVVGAAIGATAGLVLAVVGWEERLTVRVSREGVTLRRGRSSRVVPRADVDGAFVTGKQLVLLGRGGTEPARETSDLSAAALRAAFERQGYRWHADDPHAAEFARWVPDLPGLPPAADALLEELARIGVVVRDEGRRQFWRLARPPGGNDRAG